MNPSPETPSTNGGEAKAYRQDQLSTKATPSQDSQVPNSALYRSRPHQQSDAQDYNYPEYDGRRKNGQGRRPRNRKKHRHKHKNQTVEYTMLGTTQENIIDITVVPHQVKSDRSIASCLQIDVIVLFVVHCLLVIMVGQRTPMW